MSRCHLFVVGAGTTGNEVIKNLVLLGVGRITIVDFDSIEEVNLSRSVLFRDADIRKSKARIAATRAKELNPAVQIEGIDGDVVYDFGSARYRDFDCVITTVDNLEARKWVNRYCMLNRTPLIDTGVSGGIGNLYVAVGDETPCLECTWSEAQYRQLSERYSCLKLGLIQEEAKIPMVITSASVIAGIAAHECIRLLHEKSSGSRFSATGRYHWFSLEDAAFRTWRHSKKTDCIGCMESMRNAKSLSYQPGLRDKVEIVRTNVARELQADAVELWFDKEIVYSCVCSTCGSRMDRKPVFLGRFRRGLCETCHQLAVVPDDHSAELRGDYSLSELGVPPRHLVEVVYSSDNEVKKAQLIIA